MASLILRAPAAGGGGGTFTPLRRVNFDGLADQASVYSTGSTAGKRFEGMPGSVAFAAGYGTRATTAVKKPGRSSSCALLIKAGSDGDPGGGDTGAGMGAFGGYSELDTFGHQVSQGQEIWLGAWYFFPTGWSWARQGGGDQIKFQRWQHTGDSSHMDIYVLNGDYSYSNGESESSASGVGTGFGFRNEYAAAANPDTDFTSATPAIPLNQWVWVEQYVLAHSTGTTAVRRLWVNGTFVREQVGASVRWRGNDGNLHTKTVSGGIATLASSGDTLTSVAFFTYWNSYAPQDQTCYIQDIVYHKTISDLTATDEFGNKMIGVTAFA